MQNRLSFFSLLYGTHPAALEIEVDPGILDPRNKMQLAYTYWIYSRCFVTNLANRQELCFFVLNNSCTKKIGRLYHIT